MVSLTKFRPGFRRTTTDASSPVAVSELTDNNKKTAEESHAPPRNAEASEIQAEADAENISDSKLADLQPAEDAQRGVQMVEAVTLTWSKQSLIAVFILYVKFRPFACLTAE